MIIQRSLYHEWLHCDDSMRVLVVQELLPKQQPIYVICSPHGLQIAPGCTTYQSAWTAM